MPQWSSRTTIPGAPKRRLTIRPHSEYGKGWWLDGLDQLVSSGSGALLVRGNGDTLWFRDNGGTYAKAAGDTDFSTLVKNGNNTFTLTSKHGMVENFGTTGLLTSRVDPNSNTFAYAYTDGDSDAVNDELYTITDPYSRVLETLAYSGSKVSTFTDVASHLIALGYSTTKLTSVTLTDPDGGAALPAPIWGYAYNATTGLLETQTDPNTNATGFVYDSTSLRLSRINFPFGSEHSLLTPVQTYGLKTGSSNALVETVNPQGVFTDENGAEFKFKMDRFGNIIQFGHDFSGGSSNDVVDTALDPNGLPYKVLQPAIGGIRYQTLLGYNSLGDLLKVIHPDSTTQTFTYDSTFHLVLTAVDEMGRTTTFTRNAYGNELTRADNASNTWTTSYSGRSDGLPTSVTSPDPDGGGGLSAYVTGFAYDSYGQSTTTTFPDSSTQVLAYNTAGMVTSVTDELTHVTTYAYDALNRLITLTLADPDAGGAQTSSVTSFTYDGANNLLTQVDPLTKTTTYVYDERNRLESQTRPDPDGGGGNPAPQSTYSYDAVGNRTGEGYPIYANNITHAYDVYGRMTNTTWGSIGGDHKQEDWQFDVLGRMTKYTQLIPTGGASVQEDKYVYDNRGRVTKHTGHDPDYTGPGVGPDTLYTYNYAGQPATVTDPLLNVTSYSYTTAGWLNSVTLPDADGSGPLYSAIYTFGYDALGNQTGITDPNNHMSSKTWNNRGRLASDTGVDPDGAGGLSAPTTSYGYDYHGNLTSLTNPLSKVTSFGYDNINRQITMTLADPDGGGGLAAPVYGYGYNAMNSLTTETDPLGNVTTTAFDFLQRKTSITQPDPDSGGGLAAPVWTYMYGSDSLLATTTDPMSHDTDYDYDVYGRLSTVTNNDGYVTTTAYNLLDQVISVTTPDPDGGGGVTASTTLYGYDYLNRLSTTGNPLSGNTTYTYDLNNHLINLRDPDNNDTSWAYDNAGRVTMETNELSDTRSFWHDAAGNLTRKEDRNERVTQYTFDDLDRMTSELWLASGDPVPTIGISTSTQGGPINEVQRVGYSISGMLTGGTFTLSFGGNTTSAINYNASAATVQSALEGLGSIGSGNISVAKTTDTTTSKVWTVTFQGSLGGANQSQITINNSGLTFFGSKTDTQATDTNGSSANEVQVVTLSNATDGTFRLAFGGQTTAPIAYNASAATVDTAFEALQSVDTVTTTGSNGGPWTLTFTGSHAGTNVAQTQGDAAAAQSGSVSHTISYTYDTASQLTEASDSDGELDFVYDYIGRVISETQIVDGLTPHIVLATKYDAASNRTELASTLGSNADFKNTYLYDNMNRMTRVTQQSNSGNTLATKRVDFAYNALSQFDTINRYQNTGGTNVVATTAFTYDTLNRLATLNHDQGGTTLNHYTYGYDRMDRLNAITSTAEGASSYTYDKTSQLTVADHSVSGPPDESYSFDANGNRTGGSYDTDSNNLTVSDGTYDYEYDDEGNRTKKTTISSGAYEVYTWDHRNRLTGVTFKNSSHTVLKTVEHQYDILNRWTRRHTDPDGPGATAARDNFFAYDGIQPIYQFDGAADTDLIDRYLWGPAVDQILADEQVTSLGSAGNIIHPLTDHLGTARDLADQNESSYTTTITNHRTYNGFGGLTAESNSAVDCDPSYSGKITDSDTNLQNNVYRWYDAVLGQWASEDPTTFSADDPNLKRYVSNEPLDWLDSNGLRKGGGGGIKPGNRGGGIFPGRTPGEGMGGGRGEGPS